MQLTIKNIGKIENADVMLSGISVIAGENDTGKSTVGKVLFCLINSMCNFNKQILDMKINRISMLLNSGLDKASSRYMRRFDFTEYAEMICDLPIEKDKNLDHKVIELIEKAYEDIADSDIVDFKKDNIQDAANKVYAKIHDTINITDSEILRSVFQTWMDSEFENQINNIYDKNKVGFITVRTDDENVFVRVHRDRVISIRNPVDSVNEAIYIDDPFILDDSYILPSAYIMRRGYHHRDFLKSKLLSVKPNSEALDLIDGILNSRKMEKILNLLNRTCDGEILQNRRRITGYKRNGSEFSLDIKNLSTGIKAFAIIRTLIENNSLVSGTILILDEPEVHLHPEWQLIYAELIVLLRKEFGIIVIIDTHSPYFINSIEVFSKLHAIDNECRYYLAENIDKKSVVRDVTTNTDQIYKKLAAPLQMLENLSYEDVRFE